jgi:hypothetical protein
MLFIDNYFESQHFEQLDLIKSINDYMEYIESCDESNKDNTARKIKNK